MLLMIILYVLSLALFLTNEIYTLFSKILHIGRFSFIHQNKMHTNIIYK